MNKIINETLKTNGKWSMKRISAFCAFWGAILYEVGALILSTFFNHVTSKEYVFQGLLTWAGVVILGSIADKKFENKNIVKNESE
jgi:hypothetical protein